MKMTITLFLAGCMTRCDFCHSRGGRGPLMSLDAFKTAIDTLHDVLPVLESHGHEVELGLMHEPAMHPQFSECMHYALSHVSPYLNWADFEWATTGIPFAVRPDWETIFDTLKALHVNELCFTVAGPESLHDRLVHRTGALAHQQVANMRAKQAGFSTAVRLLVSTAMLDRCEQTLQLITEMEVERTEARVSDYAPVEHLRVFEAYRPDLPAILPYHEQLVDFSSSASSFWQSVETATETSYANAICSSPDLYASFDAVERRFPEWVFVSVFPDLSVYRGLNGVYTQQLGHLHPHLAADVVATLEGSSPNYEFAAFFDVVHLPPPAEIARKYASPGSQKLYRTSSQAMLKWLDVAVIAGEVAGSTIQNFTEVPQYG